MTIVVADGTALELAPGATGLDAARAIDRRLADEAVLVRVDGRPQDVRLPLEDGSRIEILTSRDRHDADALAALRDSVAHLLAEAATRLYPGTKVAGGGPTESGFYYDVEFAGPVEKDVLERLEEEIGRIVAEGRRWELEVVSRDQARERLVADGGGYRLETLEAAQSADNPVFLYRQGAFFDVCPGPHLGSTLPVEPAAVKLLSLSGAYWRGDETRPQLSRIHGTAFYEVEDLERHLDRLEEARRRDHRRLGRSLDLFHFDDHSPGSAIWHPRGTAIWNALDDLRRHENERRGYSEVKTPLLYDAELWRISGHWPKFRDDMFNLAAGTRELSLKGMNCPCHCLVYGRTARSYRELPLRLAEAGDLHRNEPSGHLHGLLRGRHFVQDDAHVFCAPGQVEEEVADCLRSGFRLYELFGLEMRVELSTRPTDMLGSGSEWDDAEAALGSALQLCGLDYEERAGAGAFYGPQIDICIQDSLGRSWKLGNLQLDFQLPRRFGLLYAGPDNVERTPVLLHRALLGSFERFVGILLEHTGGDLPVVLAPEQVRVVAVSERHRSEAAALADALRAQGFRAGLASDEGPLGRRIRRAEEEKVPYVVVWGDRESFERVSVRRNHGEQIETSLDGLVRELRRSCSAGRQRIGGLKLAAPG